MADTRDLITLAEAKRVLRIRPVDSAEDDELAVYVTAASRLVDRHFGHTVALTVTGEVHDGANRSGRAWRRTIVLNHRPVTSISAVTEYRSGDAVAVVAETPGTLPAEGWVGSRYDPDPTLYSGVLYRRVSGHDAVWEHGRGNITVNYVAGRVASTTQVDARFKRACGLVLSNLWREREPGLEVQGEFDVPRSSFPTFAVPNAVKQLLSEEWGQHQPDGIV